MTANIYGDRLDTQGRPADGGTDAGADTVTCQHCGSTAWRVTDVSRGYQTCTVDTADAELEPDDYDSGDFDRTIARSSEFAECAQCGRETTTDDQRATLARRWDYDAIGMATNLAAAVARLLDEYADQDADAGDALGQLRLAFDPWREARTRAEAGAATVGCGWQGGWNVI